MEFPCHISQSYLINIHTRHIRYIQAIERHQNSYSLIVLFHLLQDGRIDYGEFAAMMRKGGDHGTIGRNRTASRKLNLNLADAFGIKEST